MTQKPHEVHGWQTSSDPTLSRNLRHVDKYLTYLITAWKLKLVDCGAAAAQHDDLLYRFMKKHEYLSDKFLLKFCYERDKWRRCGQLDGVATRVRGAGATGVHEGGAVRNSTGVPTSCAGGSNVTYSIYSAWLMEGVWGPDCLQFRLER
ncbi:cytochrome P450 [Striga asiatica]|uniref:Cytochrome P450 n=1 Tax=Striga asiatica TaxID=4170 RepID=A0A5A7PUA4_STRAF|nr:cytochrome P450 [Striga asiatica]